MIWIIPTAVAALSFFKLGSLYVWVQMMSIVIKALAAVCLLLLTCAAGSVWWRMRRS